MPMVKSISRMQPINIWQDTNQNGQLDAAELLSLEEAGIQSLQTDY